MPYAERRETGAPFDNQELALLALLAGIALRSAAWTTVQLALHGQTRVLLALALSAGAGKLCGGVLADKLGWRRSTAGALVVAAPLLAFGGGNFVALCAGVALLQSATPAMLAATGRLLPHRPATAAGLALGLAIALGGLPLFGGFHPAENAYVLPALALAAACLTLRRASKPLASGRRSVPPAIAGG